MRFAIVAVTALLGNFAVTQAAPAANAKMRPMKARTALVVHSWADCAGRWQSADARALLAMDYRTEDYWDAVRKLARKSGQCLFPGESLRLSGSLLFAGGLAESLFEREYGREDMSAVAARFEAAKPIEARDEFEAIGLCVARRDPAGVRVLLATRPATDAEKSSLRQLAPTLQGCVRSGAQVRIGRYALRPLVALGLYRLTMNASGGTS